MSETLPRTASNPDQVVDTPTNEELHAAVYGPEATTQTTPEAVTDMREPSRATGIFNRISDTLSRLQERSDTIGGYFKKRAVNKAHSAALREYRTEHNSDFVDHVSKLTESNSEQAVVYGESQLAREHRRADRQELLDSATRFARTTGAAALEAAKTTGLVTLGVGLMAGEQAYKGAQLAAEKTKDAIDFGVQGYYDTAEAVKDSFRDARDTTLDTLTDTRDAVVEKAVDIRDTVKEKFIAAKNRALDRRAARRAKWTARKEAALNWVSDTKEQALYAGNLVKDTVLETATAVVDSGKEVVTAARQEGQRFVGETANRINTARAAGSAALEAYAATAQAHNEQNKL